MAHLIIAEQGKLKKYEITEDFLFIGRTPENQIRISDPSASRQHCQIIRIGGGLRIIDLDSEHGTLVGGKRIKQQDLREGDVIQIGAVKIAVKDVGPAPAAAPPSASAAPQRAAAAPRRTTPAAAGAAGRRAARRDEPEPIRIREDMAAAAARGGHLVRRNVRKGSKIPGWAQAVIAFWIVVIGVFIAVQVVKSMSNPYGDTFLRATELWQKEHKREEAFALYESIPFDDPEYGEKSRKNMKKIQEEREAANVQQSSIGAQRWFDNNIELFIWKYIEAPEDKPDWARAIKRDHAPDRPSFVRVLVKNRLLPFMEKYADDKRMPDVKALYDKYSKEVNIDAPPSFRDAEVECDCALNLSGYGEAYQIMSRWLAANPNTEFRERADWTFKTIQHRLDEEWKVENDKITRNEANNKPKYAIKDIDRLLKLTEGLESPEGKKFRDELMARRAQNEAKADAMAGGD